MNATWIKAGTMVENNAADPEMMIPYTLNCVKVGNV